MAINFSFGNGGYPPNQFQPNGFRGASFVRSRQLGGRAAGIFVLIMGLIFAGVGGWLVFSSQISDNWKQIDGTVSGVLNQDQYSCRDNDGQVKTTSDPAGYYDCYRNGQTYTPTASYSVNGQTYSISGHTYTDSQPAINSKIAVVYNPSNPADAKIVSDAKSSSMIGWIFNGIGILLVIIGVVMIVRGGKKSSQNGTENTATPLTPDNNLANDPTPSPVANSPDNSPNSPQNPVNRLQ